MNRDTGARETISTGAWYPDPTNSAKRIWVPAGKTIPVRATDGWSISGFVEYKVLKLPPEKVDEAIDAAKRSHE